MKKVDGIVLTVVMDGRSARTEGAFELSSESRKRYGVDATSISIVSERVKSVVFESFKLEMDTADLIEALIKGGITADDLRLYADIADGDVLIEEGCIPGNPRTR